MLTWLKGLLIALLITTSALAADPPMQILDEGSNQGVIFKIDCVGTNISCTKSGITGTITISSGSGSGVALDLADNGVDESAGITEIATTGDTNSIFTEPANDKLLIDLSADWPKADTSDDLTCTNCIGGTEIDESSLEAGLEAVLDLQDLQGAVTDAQVPNNITIDLAASANDFALADDITGTFGTGNDWEIEYAENDEDTLSLRTAATASTGVDNGMVTIAADTGNAGMTSNQEVFEIGRGAQDDGDAPFVELFSVDEDGDVYFPGKLSINTAHGDPQFLMTVPSQASTREKVAEWRVSDDSTSLFALVNSTATNSRFTPTFLVSQISNSADSAGNFIGQITSAVDTGTTPIMRFVSRLYSGDYINGTFSNVVARPLFTWQNHNTVYMTMLADGKLGVSDTAPDFALTVGTGTTFGMGSTQWNSGDSIDATKVANADLGDVSTSSGVWSIDSDAVTEAKLKAVNSAVDEDILTFESTTGDFEWHTPSELGLLTAGVSGLDFDNLIVSYGSATTATITATRVILLDSSNTPKLFSTVSETCTITTSGAGGLEASDTEASNTWYEIHLYGKSDGTIDCLMNAAGGAVGTVPSGYTFSGRVSYVRNNGSSNFVEFYQTGVRVNKHDGVVASGLNQTTFTNIDLSAHAPPSSRNVFLVAYIATTGVANSFRPDGSSFDGGNYTYSGAGDIASRIETGSNASQVIEYSLNAAGTAEIEFIGYEDNL